MGCPLPWWLWSGSLRVYFGRSSRKGLFLCNGEAAAGNLLREALVHIGHDLLEGGGVESLAQNRSPSNDVLSSLHLLSVAVDHLSLDFISQGFGFSLGFLNQGFQFLQGFNLGSDFDSRHSRYLLVIKYCVVSPTAAALMCLL